MVKHIESQQYKIISFKLEDKSVYNFIVDEASDFSTDNSLIELQQLFDVNFLKQHAHNILIKGGRGQTLLFHLSPDFNPKLTSDFKHLLPQEQNPSSLPLCLRAYLRGGMIGRIMHDKFLKYSATASRACDEFFMLKKMLAANLPVPTPIMGLEVVKGVFMKNAILMAQIPNTKNLAEILNNRSFTAQECLNIGQTLANFFAHNVYHSDLNIRNILLNDEGKCFLIDFDKCHIENQPLMKIDIGKMLSRLERSFEKELTLNSNLKFKMEDFKQICQPINHA